MRLYYIMFMCLQFHRSLSGHYHHQVGADPSGYVPTAAKAAHIPLPVWASLGDSIQQQRPRKHGYVCALAAL
ncbi:hypothetical protein DPMN_092085 [Dreissena polymorpha]|uniref:Uncharacterized protein n=1 Tax=Dreissena polymorpha TaxID=45954 RepID=A0A9D4L0N7_DREPO|nr:hypothetical protein DPMN_092085 [Dreissena polymorpha]